MIGCRFGSTPYRSNLCDWDKINNLYPSGCRKNNELFGEDKSLLPPSTANDEVTYFEEHGGSAILKFVDGEPHKN